MTYGEETEAYCADEFADGNGGCHCGWRVSSRLTEYQGWGGPRGVAMGAADGLVSRMRSGGLGSVVGFAQVGFLSVVAAGSGWPARERQAGPGPLTCSL